MLALGSDAASAAAALLRAPDDIARLGVRSHRADRRAQSAARRPRAQRRFPRTSWIALDAYRRDGATCRALHPCRSCRCCASIDHAAKNWRRARRSIGRPSLHRERASDGDDIGNMLMHAYPDRIARQDDQDPRRYRLSNGRGAHLHENSELIERRWLVVDRPALRRTRQPDHSPPRHSTRRYLERDFGDRSCASASCAGTTARARPKLRTWSFRRARTRTTARADATRRRARGLLAAMRALGIAQLPWSDQARALRARIARARMGARTRSARF